jgi:hypothetical protein
MRKTIGSLAAVAAAGALTFAVLPVASASAGSNGQQVSVCTPGWADTARIEGTNQNGVQSTEVIHVRRGLCHVGVNVTYDWWWKGTVTISLAGNGGPFVFDHTCEVPVKQRKDLVTC